MTTIPLELWQTEWCPSSHRVRQRLTELGLTYVVRQVPVDREERAELRRRTGHDSIPVLCAGEQTIAGEDAIATHLNTHYAEPSQAEPHRARAAKARRKDLEQACRQLTPLTR